MRFRRSEEGKDEEGQFQFQQAHPNQDKVSLAVLDESPVMEAVLGV